MQNLYQHQKLTKLSVFLNLLAHFMKFGIIRERKNPPDRRVVFSPEKLAEAKKLFPQAEFPRIATHP